MTQMMEIKETVHAGKPLKNLPARLHHHGYTTEDHERTRYFYETVLGIPLVALYIEREQVAGELVELAHAFYELGDGSTLAFFNFADPEKQATWRAKEQSMFVHIALLVERSTQREIVARLAAYGIKSFMLEHGYCTSLYVADPNGLMLEFTVDLPRATEIAAEMATTAHQDLRRWMAGDRRVNNRWRTYMSPVDLTPLDLTP